MKIQKTFWNLSNRSSTSEFCVGTSRSLGSLCLCKRDSRSTVAFSVYGTVGLFPRATKDWGSKSHFAPGEKNVKENPLVDINKVLFPPLHTKLDLMRNLCERRKDKKRCCLPKPVQSIPSSQFFYAQERHLRRTKNKTRNAEEQSILNHLRTWERFTSVCRGFLGNTWLTDYSYYYEDTG